MNSHTSMKRHALGMACCLLIAGGCMLHSGRFKQLALKAPADLVVTSEQRVKGEDCSIFIPLLGTPTLEKAAVQAIAKAPAGTTGLKDAVVHTYYSAFLGELCWRVEGTPVR